MGSVTGDTVSEDMLEAAARQLEASGRYRVLRRLDLAACLIDRDGSPTRLGMFLDIESTGLDPLICEPIELAILPFEYQLDGAIVAIHSSFHQFNEPSAPIPPEITKITGITNEMVAGQRIDNLGEGALAKWRAAHVGFVFQFYNLLPMLSARKNVELTIAQIRRDSSVLSEMESQHAIRIAGSMYNLSTGAVEFFS